MRNRSLAAVLCVVLLAAFLSACAGAPAASNPPAGTAKPGAAPTAAAQKGPISVAILDRGAVPPDKGTYEDNAVTKWINENSPVKVNFVAVPRGETTNKYNTMLAAGTAPDIFMEFQPDMTETLVNQGVLMEVGPLLDKYGADIRRLTPPETMKWAMYNGKEYAVPMIRSDIGVANWMLWYRDDWREKVGVPVPTDIDSFYNMIKAFVEKDPDGNGQKDTYGYSLAAIGPGVIQEYFGVQGGFWYPAKDGMWDLDYVSDGMRDAKAFVRKILTEGIADKEYITDKNSQKMTEDFVTGKCGVYPQGTGYINNIYATLMKNQPSAKPLPLRAISGPYGQSAYYQERKVNFLNMIPAASKHGAEAVEYLNWMMASGAWETVKYGEEGKHYKKVNGIIVATYDDATFKSDLTWRGEYATMAAEDIKPADMKTMYSEAAPDIQASRALNALAIEVNLQDKFWRPTPTSALGLDIGTQVTNLKAASDAVWEKFLADPSMTPEAAQAEILKQWNGLGYQELRKQFSDKAKELNISTAKP